MDTKRRAETITEIQDRLRDYQPAKKPWRVHYLEDCAFLLAALREAERLDFTGHDHPEANGRHPTPGAFEWTFSFTLEDSRVLKVHVGEKGFRAFEDMFLKNRDADYLERGALQRRVEVLTAACYEMLQHLKSEPAVDAKIAPDEYYMRWEAALRGGERE